MKGIQRLFVVLLGLALVGVFSMSTASAADTARNVIVLIPDGCDATVQTAARWYKGEPLAVDKMDRAAVQSYMANSIITGSAAAATAFASGHKTSVRFLGVGPDPDLEDHPFLTGYESAVPPYAPVATVLEGARAMGKATGVIATSRITHATPAAYYCHIHDRGMDNDIMQHLVYSDLDVVFGGGFRHLIPSNSTYTTTFGATWGGKRTDGEDLHQVLLNNGVQFVDNRDDMMALTAGKAWGLFDDSHMDADLDRMAFHPTQPSIAEMTSKALEILSQNENGFFIMIEGSQVDWAGHANDPIYMITDFIAWDNAVQVALDFADQNPDTLVLAFPDHNTGGMKIGQYRKYGQFTTEVNQTGCVRIDSTSHYTQVTIEDLIDPLLPMTLTSTGIIAKVDDGMTLEEAVQTYWGITLTPADLDEYDELVNQAKPVYDTYAISRVVSRNYTGIGWTTHGHNAEDVPVWSYGDGEVEGTVDNTDLATYCAEKMGFDLDALTQNLYMDADVALPGRWSITSTSRDDNPLLVLGNATIPLDTNRFMVNGGTFELQSLVVYAPETGKVYMPWEAVWYAVLVNGWW